MSIRKFALKAFDGKCINRTENIYWEVFRKRCALEQKCTENCNQNS